jgi:hypothetical protein
MRPSPNFDEENANHNLLKAGPRDLGFVVESLMNYQA